MTVDKPSRRGSQTNATGRFEPLTVEPDLSDYGFIDEEDLISPQTQFFKDSSKSILSENNSPDIPFRYSMNLYRGCEHGCAYCYARPTHEYLGLSAGVDFESKIFVKTEAPDLLRKKLMSKSWKPESITLSGVTDCYQPAERRFRLTRKCLEILNEFKNPAFLITKNQLVLRDLDILSEMARDNLVAVTLSVTTLDRRLAHDLEPRTSPPQSRLKAIEKLAAAGVPVGVFVAPVILGLTDHEMPQILKLAREAGARWASFVPLRLPHSVATIFSDWLSQHRPESRTKVLKFLKDIRGGELNDPNFGSRMRGSGPRAKSLKQMFEVFTKKLGYDRKPIEVCVDKFKRPTAQMCFEV